ncbi:hypothetical protein ACET3Z_001687 [Daucus carota]
MLECKYSREIAKGITLDVNDELATKALTEANEFHLVKNYLEEMLHQATKEVKSVKGFMKEFKPNTFQVKTNGTDWSFGPELSVSPNHTKLRALQTLELTHAAIENPRTLFYYD